jgi:RND family efflux transporter MFP subunit
MLDAARQRLNRAERMLKDGTGSARALEDARQEFELTETGWKTAEAKLEQLRKAPLDSDVVMTLSSPLSGILRQVFAAPGQQVASGAALAEVVEIDPVWIRVPVYAGRLGAFAPGAAARVSPLGGRARGVRTANPVSAPPTADPLAVTADLYFELSNSDARLRPGEKVDVTLPLRGQEAALKVPATSILYDMHGGAWLYENTAPQVFVRRRIEVAQMQGDIALLRAGPAQGARVVTAGAAELFGTEFGPGK